MFSGQWTEQIASILLRNLKKPYPTYLLKNNRKIGSIVKMAPMEAAHFFMLITFQAH